MTEHARSSLRQRQADELRASLRAAFVQLILEHGGSGFSLHEVAAAAGVSDRTLYRHYPSRDALVEAILTEEAARFERERRHGTSETEIYGDGELIADAFDLFETHGDLIHAIRMLRAAGVANPAARERTAKVRARVEVEGCHPAAVEQLTGLLRLVTGADGWARLREPDLDLDAREAGYAAHWAAQVLLQAARGVDGPLRPRLTEAPDGHD